MITAIREGKECLEYKTNQWQCQYRLFQPQRSGAQFDGATRSATYNKPMLWRGVLVAVFPDYEKTIKELARKGEERIRPVRASDESEEFPWPIIRDMAAADVPHFRAGGIRRPGGGSFELVLAMEELSRICSGVAISFAASALGSYTDYGSEALKKKFLPTSPAQFALTESAAGSDGLRHPHDGRNCGLTCSTARSNSLPTEVKPSFTAIIALTDKAKGARGAARGKGNPPADWQKREKDF